MSGGGTYQIEERHSRRVCHMKFRAESEQRGRLGAAGLVRQSAKARMR